MRRASVIVGVVAVGLAAGASAVMLARFGQYGLLGFDTYPLIAGSASVREALTQPLMWGFYPDPFYRPLLALSFSADRAMWGLEAWGYHMTDAIAFGLAALAVAGLAARLAGSRAVAPLVALVVFLLHPTHVEVLPVPARRGELLCCLFIALALLLALAPRTRAFGRGVLPALATLLAIASKETGFIAVPLVLIATLCWSERAGWAARFVEALWSTLPHALAAAAMVAIRLAVLGGLGGHRSVSLVEFTKGSFTSLFTVVGWLVAPQPSMIRSGAGRILFAALGAWLLALAWVWVTREPSSGLAGGSRMARGLVVALAWVLLLDLIYAAAGWLDTWYALLPVAGWAMMMGLVAAAGARVLGSGDNRLKAVAIPPLVLLAVLVTWQASYSPLFRPYIEWKQADELTHLFFQETGRRLDTASAGDVVVAPAMPIWIRAHAGRPAVFGAAVLADYTVQAWADVTHPDKRVVVARSADPSLVPAPGQILLRIPQRFEIR